MGALIGRGLCGRFVNDWRWKYLETRSKLSCALSDDCCVFDGD